MGTLQHGFSTKTAARLAHVSLRQMQYWREQEIIVPGVRHEKGRAGKNLFSWTDLIALRTMSTLKAAGISLQALRKVAEVLRLQDPPRSFADTWLVSDGLDVFMREGDVLISTLQHPGQTTHMLFVLDLGAVEAELRQEMEQMAA